MMFKFNFGISAIKLHKVADNFKVKLKQIITSCGASDPQPANFKWEKGGVPNRDP